MNEKGDFSYRIKQNAKLLGFNDCGISPVQHLEKEASRLKQWITSGLNGQMVYMAGHFEKRVNPEKLVPGAKSVISVILNYYPSDTQKDKEAPKISKYAYGYDYHKIIKNKLNKLLQFIRKTYPKVNGRFFVDSAPVMDKVWAARSGLGWIGKNTNLISRKNGSFVFIGELIIDLELEYDIPEKDYCGTCTLCIDACPTGAIVKPYLLDARKCISYFTIEYKEELPSEMKDKFENWVFGCDICQDVCPWNLKCLPHDEPDFNPHPRLLEMSKDEWFNLSEREYNKIFKNSAVRRAKYSGLKRNLDFIRKK